ncbi:hypothetical protein [Streptacidiphilus rugosus]|uniref:hypothetical protein n=1 Tax=Streptacidiphilus rugosus TaxID=405783 RepID=UPI0012F87E91|nr:hypothetical protein [Streptacidiphilus rugosus]
MPLTPVGPEGEPVGELETGGNWLGLAVAEAVWLAEALVEVGLDGALEVGVEVGGAEVWLGALGDCDALLVGLGGGVPVGLGDGEAVTPGPGTTSSVCAGS